MSDRETYLLYVIGYLIGVVEGLPTKSKPDLSWVYETVTPALPRFVVEESRQ